MFFCNFSALIIKFRKYFQCCFAVVFVSSYFSYSSYFPLRKINFTFKRFHRLRNLFKVDPECHREIEWEGKVITSIHQSDGKNKCCH